MGRFLLLVAVLCAQLSGADLSKKLLKAVAVQNEDAILEALAEIGPEPSPSMVKALLQAGIHAPSMRIYKKIRTALGNISGKAALQTLGKMARTSRSLDARVLAIYALQDIHLPETIELLLPLLKEKDPQIAIRVAETLGKKPHRDAVTGLLEALPRADRVPGELSMTIRRSLYRLTNHNFRSHEDWEKWWRTVKATWKPPTEIEVLGRTAGVKIKPPGEFPTFFGVEIYSLKVVFVIDISGSMLKAAKEEDEPPIDLVKTELQKVIRSLRPQARFSIVAFNDRMRSFNDKLLPASPKTKINAVNFVGSLRPDGWTWTQEALDRAFSFKDANTIVLLSDGSPAKKEEGLLPTEPIIEWLQKANRFRQVTIHTIGFPGANVPFMQEIADTCKGTYREVGSKSQLEPPQPKKKN